MKYLFLIIRHFFPRKRWVTTKELKVLGEDKKIEAIIVIQKDQFGNIKQTKISSDIYYTI